MAEIIHKLSEVKGKVPVDADLSLGELAINTLDGKVFLKRNDGTILNISGYNFIGISADYTAKYRDYIYCDGGVIITLPLDPNTNDILVVSDINSEFNTTPVTIERNGKTILGLEENLTLNTDNNVYEFIYSGTDWRVQQTGYGASELAEDYTPELSGTLDCNNNKIDNVEVVLFNSLYDNGTKTTAWTLNPLNAQYQKVTIDDTCTMSITTPDNPCTVYLHIYQSGAGNVLTYPSAEWVGGVETTNSIINNAHDILMVHYTGTGYVFNLMKDLKTP